MKFKISGQRLSNRDRDLIPRFKKFDVISEPTHFCSEKAAQKWMNKFPHMLKINELSYAKGYGLIYFIRESDE